jgi:hypothetical protein
MDSPDKQIVGILCSSHGKGIEQRGGLYQRRLKRAEMGKRFLKNA